LPAFGAGLAALLLTLGIAADAAVNARGDVATLSRATYADKLHGFWLGQSIANWTGLVSEMDRVGPPFYTDEQWGMPDEPSIWGHYAAHSGRLDFYLATPDRVWGADDDTDIEYLYQHLMSESKDPLLSAQQIRDGWLRHIYSNEDAPLSATEFRRENFLWVSNESAYYLMKDQGLLPPHTSDPDVNPNASMIDAQLTTELFGIMAPLRPDVALRLAELPIRVTASDEAAAIARFYVVMHSLAAGIGDSDDVTTALFSIAQRAKAQLPDHGYAKDMFEFVWEAYRTTDNTDDWEVVRDAVYERYQRDGAAGYRYREPFDAGINFAASLISLFFGEGDIARTVRIASLTGWDSDNPAATWGGLLGFILGRQAVEDAFGAGALSERYWIHRTRRGFPDYTPEQPGEDSFPIMAARGVDIVDRVVTMHMHGAIDRDADLWLIPSQP
jgi:hypothetical protein